MATVLRTGQFTVVHNIGADDEGWVSVADRENPGVQAFDANGTDETQWNDVHRPCERGLAPPCDIGELGPAMPVMGPGIGIATVAGRGLARLGDLHTGEAPGQFIGPHGAAVDFHGDIDVGEVSWTNTGRFRNPPASCAVCINVTPARCVARTAVWARWRPLAPWLPFATASTAAPG
jgi:hypothetical protein